MKIDKMSRSVGIALAGDLVTLALVTLFGFATHGTLGSAGMRMATTFFPLALAWFLIAPHLGVYAEENLAGPVELWRPFWAMILAGPLAAWLRGVLLNQPILPVFVIVLGGVSALAVLAWRFIFWLVFKR